MNERTEDEPMFYGYDHPPDDEPAPKAPATVSASASQPEAPLRTIEAILRHQFPQRAKGHFRVVARDILDALTRVECPVCGQVAYNPMTGRCYACEPEAPRAEAERDAEPVDPNSKTSQKVSESLESTPTTHTQMHSKIPYPYAPAVEMSDEAHVFSASGQLTPEEAQAVDWFLKYGSVTAIDNDTMRLIDSASNKLRALAASGGVSDGGSDPA